MFEQIFADAEKAGAAALDAFTEKYGYDVGACGFAWVIVRPARGKFVNWCKKQIEKAGADLPEGRERKMAEQTAERTYGSLHWQSGWQFWQPASRHYRGQSVDAYEAAARAFAKVLNDNGIPAIYQSRMD